MKRPNHDDVRQVALNVLLGHPNGIKQADLWRLVEAEMSNDYDVDSNLIKNSLWNLTETHGHLVEKVKKSAKSVLLFPSPLLVLSEAGETEDEIEEEDSYDDPYYDKEWELARGSFFETARAVMGTEGDMRDRYLKTLAQTFVYEAPHLSREHIEASVLLTKLLKDWEDVFALFSKLYHAEYIKR
jgi:hypothetical protein